MELLKSVRQTRKKPPSIHSHFSSSVIFPPGPIGLGLTSPSTVHEPVSTSNFLCSGPGLGGPSCANATAATTSHAANMIPARFMKCLRKNRLRIKSTYELDVRREELKAPNNGSRDPKAAPRSPSTYQSPQ